MIPSFDELSGLLPPGIHWVTWAELEERFSGNSRRTMLLQGLRRAAENLRDAGCHFLYIDGSFVTDRDIPGDFDGCWDPTGVDPAKLDPVLLTFGPGRLAQKAKYHGELFPASAAANTAGSSFLEFFQISRDGVPKGIIALDLTVL